MEKVRTQRTGTQYCTMAREPHLIPAPDRAKTATLDMVGFVGRERKHRQLMLWQTTWISIRDGREYLLVYQPEPSFGLERSTLNERGEAH